jgi:hypothetical protein
MAEVVYSGSDRTVRAGKIKDYDIAIPVADEGAVRTGTNHLSEVVNARDDGAVIIGLITGTADLDSVVLFVNEESVAGEIVSDYFALLVNVREPNYVFPYFAQKVKSQRYVSSSEFIGSTGAIADAEQS